MSRSELLTRADPLLPVVRRRAEAGDRSALAWLMDSARAWARVEFVRRAQRREREGRGAENEYQWEERIYELRLHQVAVCVVDNEPLSGEERRSVVYAGFLRRAAMVHYLDIELASGRTVAGMWEYVDIIELPLEWRVRAWPT